MINKMVTYKVKQESLDDAKMLVRELVENIKLNEEGTLLYRALQQNDDPTRFIHFMSFEDEYSEEVHRKSNYCDEFNVSILPMCDEEPSSTELNRLAFHD